MLCTRLKQQSLHLPPNAVTLPPLCKTPEKRESRVICKADLSYGSATFSNTCSKSTFLITGTPHIPLVSYQHLKLALKPGLRTLASIYLPLTWHLQSTCKRETPTLPQEAILFRKKDTVKLSRRQRRNLRGVPEYSLDSL